MEVHTLAASEIGDSSYLLVFPGAGEAVAIDAFRDIDAMVRLTEAHGVALSWALETHVHNDFVSGARELASATGAKLGASVDAGLRYPYDELRDGQELAIGSYRLRVLATPGHTPEHVGYLLVDESGEPLTLFSGGSLMVGTAARTDLLGPAESWRMATAMRNTLHERLLKLPDSVQVLPTHGGGFCATGASADAATTIGRERVHNPLLLADSYGEFIARVLDQGEYPSYFRRMRFLNQSGAPLLGRHLPAPPRLTLEQFEAWLAQGAVILDIRPGAAFAEAHIPGSYAVGVDGSHSTWVGWLVSPETPLLLVSDSYEQEHESVRQLSRIGYDRIVGTLDGGLATWTAAGRSTRRLRRSDARELAKRLTEGERVAVVDVRERREWTRGHIPGSINVPAHDMPLDGTRMLPNGPELAIHCGKAYRGFLGASLVEQLGHDRITVIEDGYSGWTALHELSEA